MPESETEDEILARIETALQKIAAAGKPAVSGNFDKGGMARALDAVIGRLKEGMEPPGALQKPSGGGAQSTE